MKIFLNNKYIEFIRTGTSIPGNDSTLYIRYDGDESLFSSFSKLEKDKDIQRLIVGCDDVEKIFSAFKKNFRVIEAAGGLVKNKKGESLLIFRNGKWDLPKGKLDKEEEVKHAALREVEEECGVKDLSIEKELPSTYHIYELKGEKILKRTSWFAMLCADASELIPQTEEGITEVRWMNEKEIADAMKNMFPSVKNILSGFIR